MFRYTRVVAFALLLTGSVTLAACSNDDSNDVSRTSAGDIDVADGYELYENSEYDFAMQYPADWSAEEGAYGSVVAFISPVDEGDLFAENINILTEEIPDELDLNLNGYVNLNKTQLENFITEYELVDEGDVDLNGTDAKYLVYQGTQGVNTLKWYQVYTLTDDQAFVITSTAGVDTYADFEDAFMDMVGTFMFVE
jgi:hypothetical protein